MKFFIDICGHISTHTMSVPVRAQQLYENTHTRKKHQKSPQVTQVSVSTLPLSYPSPPLLTKHRNIPLTSTLIASPPKPFNAEDYSIHPTSPEISTIPQKYANATTYQKYEAGIAYLPPNLFKSQATNSQPQAVTNLSRFNVSPPHNPRPGTSEGTIQNTNKVEHSQVRWICDPKTKKQNMVVKPRKVNLFKDRIISIKTQPINNRHFFI